MKRRDFLKLIGVAPIAPSVLAAKATVPFKPNYAQEKIAKTIGYTVPIDHYYIGWTCRIIKGKGAGQIRCIASYDGATRIVTVRNPWDIMPDETSILKFMNPYGVFYET